MKRRQFLASLTVLASGCGGGGSGGNIAPSPVPQLNAAPPVERLHSPRLLKGSVIETAGTETGMVVFGGEALSISFIRGFSGSEGTTLRIRRWATGAVIAEHPWPGGLGCATVEGGLIHVYGSSAWQNPGNRVIHSTLDSITFLPTSAVDALLMDNPSSPYRIWNTSVTKDASGYMMAVESDRNVRFAHSADLNSFSFVGGIFNEGNYTGCPSIHYINGVHWITFLAHVGEGVYETRVARSTDNCSTFIYGKALMFPEPSDGKNTSDLDMVEIGGQVVGVYADGDQLTYSRMRSWTYDGTLEQMFLEHA